MKLWFCCGWWALVAPPVSPPAPLPLPSGTPRPLPAVLDTLLPVRGHLLHFRVWRGRAPAMLFEAGGGDAGAI